VCIVQSPQSLPTPECFDLATVVWSPADALLLLALVPFLADALLPCWCGTLTFWILCHRRCSSPLSSEYFTTEGARASHLADALPQWLL